MVNTDISSNPSDALNDTNTNQPKETQIINLETRNIKEVYKPEYVFKVITKHTGFGINSEFVLEPDDLIGVIKKVGFYF